VGRIEHGTAWGEFSWSTRLRSIDADIDHLRSRRNIAVDS
jgi:hypothetical protein